MLSKQKIIIISALAISLLLNIPRVLVILMRQDFAKDLGFTYSEVGLRVAVMFSFSWLVMSYNINWKKYWPTRSPQLDFLRDAIINILLLFLGVKTLAFFKQFTEVYIYDVDSFLFITFFIYLVVLIILLLLSWLVNLTTRHQQSILEKEKAKQQALHHQLDALRSQFNPHFLFNTLNSLSTLIRKKPEQASVFVDKLSWLLRATLQQSDKDFITLQEELDYLAAYVFLQKERFGEKLQVAINVPEDWRREMVPSFSLQLLVENAIKHNVVATKQPLTVEIYAADGFLIVGNPIQQRSDRVDSTGKGLSNLATRFRLLKKKDLQIEKTEQQFLVKLPIL